MTYETKDSGERSEYDSGMVRDTNKGKARFDLLVPLGQPYEEHMLTRFAALMARGAGKYGDRNWEKAEGVEEFSRFRESAFRHFMQWFTGERDGEDHAAAVFFNIMAAEYVRWKMAQDAATLGGIAVHVTSSTPPTPPTPRWAWRRPSDCLCGEINSRNCPEHQ